MDVTPLTHHLRRHRRAWLLALAAVVGTPLAVVLVAAAYFWNTTSGFADRVPPQPSRLYGAPLGLAPGAAADREALIASLRALGYRRSARAPEIGEMQIGGDRLTVRLHAAGGSPVAAPAQLAGRRVEATFSGRRVETVAVDGKPLGPRETVDLGRPLLWSYHDDSLRETRPVRLAELPPHVVEAILAAEDAKFFRHSGLAPVGIARAAVENVRAGEVRQGGSTITQQLVKNLYLDPRRSFARKAREAVLALLLEARYGKERILAAYLDEIYWGRADGLNLHGLGAAARAYFDKEASELDVAEAATLAGMIQAPASYSPFTAADAALRRRDWVLERMERRGWLDPAAAAAARAQPLRPRAGELQARNAPYFAAAMAAEAERRFGIDGLAGSGHTLLSTLSALDQHVAEREVRAGLERLERSYPDGRDATLQAALVSLDPRDGRVLAWVGGRDWSRSQFDRVAQARRQAGSAFKPVVYAAAFASGRLEPWELLQDSPILVRFDRTEWRPRNSDHRFHGAVSPRTALELSLNVPTVRVAMRTGVDRLQATAAQLGIDSPLPAVPALALGACEVTPLEIARVYATFAAGGRRPEPWGLEAVYAPGGEELTGEEVPLPERALRGDVAYLVTSMLRGVLDRGTAWRARELGVRGPLAGKTGTTDDRRDNWFAGYSADRVTAVWVGYDENRPTRLSGSRGALPLWSRFTARVAPADGYLEVPRPPGFVTVELDPTTGMLATPRCPRRVREEMPAGMAPFRRCDGHAPPPALLAAHGVWEAPGPSAAPRERTLGDLITRGAPDAPPVRLRGDVTRLFGAGRDIQVGGPGGHADAGITTQPAPGEPRGDEPPPPPAAAPSRDPLAGGEPARPAVSGALAP